MEIYSIILIFLGFYTSVVFKCLLQGQLLILSVCLLGGEVFILNFVSSSNALSKLSFSDKYYYLYIISFFVEQRR